MQESYKRNRLFFDNSQRSDGFIYIKWLGFGKGFVREAEKIDLLGKVW